MCVYVHACLKFHCGGVVTSNIIGPFLGVCACELEVPLGLR